MERRRMWARAGEQEKQGEMIGRWAERQERMSLATVPQGNEESGGGQRRKGESGEEEREREKEGVSYIPPTPADERVCQSR